jgi:hypothetical protein
MFVLDPDDPARDCSDDNEVKPGKHYISSLLLIRWSYGCVHHGISE